MTTTSTNTIAPQARWFALYTKPHKEYAVRDHLAGRQVEVYLPEIRNKTQRPDRPVRRPFFPHYLLARLNLGDGIMAHVPWTPGLRTIVSFEGRPAPIPDQMVAHIRRKMTEMSEAEPEEPFAMGERVRVFLECTHRLMAAELDLDDLQPDR